MGDSSQSSLVELPREILHGILIECEVTDLASLCVASRVIREYIVHNQLLYKEHFLRRFDAVPSGVDEIDWEEWAQHTVMLEKILSSDSFDRKRDALSFVGPQVFRLIKNASVPMDSSRNIAFLETHFKKPLNAKALLNGASLYSVAADAGCRAASELELRQLSAKLQVYEGTPVDYKFSSGFHLREYARARVYDMAYYVKASYWGPFKEDFSREVDWEKLQCILIVLRYNLQRFHLCTEGRFPLLWNKPWQGIVSQSFVSLPPRNQKNEQGSEYESTIPPQPSPAALQDPYGITGTWMRVVCFVDYADFYSFNFVRAQGVDALLGRQRLAVQEAIRLIMMQLRATKVEPPGPEDHPGYPVTHFEGTSRSMHSGLDLNANSGIRGTVRMTPQGEVHWTSFSVFHGDERWRSEGIQIGGIGSGRGIWGTWFDKDFDPEGPAGPTALWKVSNELPPEDTSYPSPAHIRALFNMHGPEYGDENSHPYFQNVPPPTRFDLGSDDEEDGEREDSEESEDGDESFFEGGDTEEGETEEGETQEEETEGGESDGGDTELGGSGGGLTAEGANETG